MMDFGFYNMDCMDGMAELTVAINKAWRSRHDYVETQNTDYVDYENILEEMADTLIMIWQMKYLLGVGEGELYQIIESKLDRQIERINQE